ncbi:uncharacterized protein LOC116624860 [Phoca vitulina]|uniref:uncharacterized protein LOC116624860 n=1 Tax=Phoca vitulina TaxID=9720 RepID=UPI001395D37A|nr:uncharacterized protein LOC116624860 [Phoca vitulina]
MSSFGILYSLYQKQMPPPLPAPPRAAPRPRRGFCHLGGGAAPHHVPPLPGPGAAGPAPVPAARGEARPRRAARPATPRRCARVQFPPSRRYLGGVGEAPGLRAPELLHLGTRRACCGAPGFLRASLSLPLRLSGSFRLLTPPGLSFALTSVQGPAATAFEVKMELLGEIYFSSFMKNFHFMSFLSEGKTPWNMFSEEAASFISPFSPLSQEEVPLACDGLAIFSVSSDHIPAKAFSPLADRL